MKNRKYLRIRLGHATLACSSYLLPSDTVFLRIAAGCSSRPACFSVPVVLHVVPGTPPGLIARDCKD